MQITKNWITTMNDRKVKGARESVLATRRGMAATRPRVRMVGRVRILEWEEEGMEILELVSETMVFMWCGSRASSPTSQPTKQPWFRIGTQSHDWFYLMLWMEDFVSNVKLEKQRQGESVRLWMMLVGMAGVGWGQVKNWKPCNSMW